MEQLAAFSVCRFCLATRNPRCQRKLALEPVANERKPVATSGHWPQERSSRIFPFAFVLLLGVTNQFLVGVKPLRASNGQRELFLKPALHPAGP